MDRVELFEFFVEGHDQTESHVLLHITEPATSAEREKGYFFALVEIQQGTVEQIEHMQHIIDDIESTYYDTTEDGTDKDPFEATLEFMNRRSKYVLDEDNEVHSLIGVIRDDHISFSYHGEPHAILFYSKDGEYRVTNILESYDEETEEDSLFSSLVQGDIQPGDVFLLATPMLQKYFSHDRIRKLLSTRTPKDTAQHVQKVLSDLAAAGSFGGIFYHIQSVRNLPNMGKRQKQTQSSQESLDHLLESERQTAETLSPPLFGNFGRKKEPKPSKAPEKRTRKQKQSSKPSPETNYRKRQQEPPQEGGILATLGRGIFHILQWLWIIIQKITILVGRFFLVLIILITNKNNSRKSIITSLQDRLNRSKGAVRNLSFISKALFVGMIILTIIFIGSVSAIKMRENSQAKTQAYTTAMETISSDIDKAEAAILYDNNDEAITLLEHARTELGNLEDEKDGVEERLVFAEKIESIYLNLRKVTFANPETIANITDTDSNAQTTRLARIDDSLIAYSEDNTTYYIIGRDSGSVEQKVHDTIPTLGPNATPKEQLDIVFMSGADTVGVYNKETKTLTEKTIGYPNDNVSITGAAIYNLSLYTIDAAHNQLYKHSRTQAGYDRGTEWLGDTIDLSDATSLSIDGDIYILKKSGSVVKLNRGASIPFGLDQIDPAINNPSVLWTSANVEYIYILEPTNKRVLIFDKRGGFVGQHTHEAWVRPTDMVVDEKRGDIYILDQNTVYTFDLPAQ